MLSSSSHSKYWFCKSMSKSLQEFDAISTAFSKDTTLFFTSFLIILGKSIDEPAKVPVESVAQSSFKKIFFEQKKGTEKS